MTARADRRGRRWLRNGAAIVAMVASGQTCAQTSAQSATYRCDDSGKVTYTNLACTTGRQTTVQDLPRGPSAEDRAAAASRRRADALTLAALERERAAAQRDDERVASRARKNADHDKRAATCAKLALRAKHAAEDAETAGPRDQARKRILARRAEEADAANCRRR